MSRGKAPSQRQLRVGEELRHALAAIMARAAFRDPLLQDVVVTVTEVRASADLKTARAFVVPLGGGDARPIVAALNRARGYFRGALGREVKLRYTPDITFVADGSFDAAEKIEKILSRPAVRRDLTIAEAAGTEQDATGDAMEVPTDSDRPGARGQDG